MNERSRVVVLVVEDEPDHRMMLEMLLESCGYDVLSAASCAEGRALLLAREIDVLLTDFFLGDATAVTLVADLGPRRPQVAILMSGLDEVEQAERTREGGFDAHIMKPTSLAVLREHITEGLRRRPSGIRLAKTSPAEELTPRAKRAGK